MIVIVWSGLECVVWPKERQRSQGGDTGRCVRPGLDTGAPTTARSCHQTITLIKLGYIRHISERKLEVSTLWPVILLFSDKPLVIRDLLKLRFLLLPQSVVKPIQVSLLV